MPRAQLDIRYAVLMARIVNGAGVAVRRSWVNDITYSVYRFDPNDSNHAQPVAGQVNVAIDVAEVFVDSLRRGEQWMLDTIGYNFRHEIELGDIPVSRRPARFQLRYEISTTCGQKAVLRFDVRRNHHD